MKKENVNEKDIVEIISKNSTKKAKYRLSLRQQKQNDLLYTELSNMIEIGKRYDSKDRSNMLVLAEKNIFKKHRIELNIKKVNLNEIHGKTSKGIFNTLFNIKSHVYGGHHSISIVNLDPLFFSTTN